MPKLAMQHAAEACQVESKSDTRQDVAHKTAPLHQWTDVVLAGSLMFRGGQGALG